MLCLRGDSDYSRFVGECCVIQIVIFGVRDYCNRTWKNLFVVLWSLSPNKCQLYKGFKPKECFLVLLE